MRARTHSPLPSPCLIPYASHTSLTQISSVSIFFGSSQEQSQRLLHFTHYYTFDHLLNTFYTFLFAVAWWNAPHDGVRELNSKAQEAMVDLAKSRGEIGGQELTAEQLRTLAMVLWGKEKMVAVLVLIACWVVKVSTNQTNGRALESYGKELCGGGVTGRRRTGGEQAGEGHTG